MDNEELIQEHIDELSGGEVEYNAVTVIDDVVDVSVQSEDVVSSVESEEIEISIDEASGPHALRIVADHAKDLPNQHTIGAIENLTEELDNIKKIGTVYSNKYHQANYYMWKDENPSQENRSGYFVAVHPDGNKIRLCKASEDAFGVTVSDAGFIGNQNEEKSRNSSYSLVVNSGLVSVRRERNVRQGDYVVSNYNGVAKKTDGTYGYFVTSISDIDGDMYATIILAAPTTRMKELAEKTSNVVDRMNSAEINIATAISVANQAFNKASTIREWSQSNIENIAGKVDNVKDKVDNVKDKVDNVNNKVDNVNNKVDNVAGDVGGLSAEVAANAKKAEEVQAVVAEEIERVNNNNNATNSHISALINALNPDKTWVDPENGDHWNDYFVDYIKDGNIPTTTRIKELDSNLNELDGDLKNANKSIAQMFTSISQNAVSIEQMATSIDNYSVGEWSQAYGLKLGEAWNILRTSMIYIPTPVTHKEVYEYETIDTWGVDEEEISKRNINTVYRTIDDGKYWRYLPVSRFVYTDCGSVDDLYDLNYKPFGEDIGCTYNVLNGGNRWFQHMPEVAIAPKGVVANSCLKIYTQEGEDITSLFTAGEVYDFLQGLQLNLETLTKNGWTTSSVLSEGTEITIHSFSQSIICNDGDNITWTGYSWQVLNETTDFEETTWTNDWVAMSLGDIIIDPEQEFTRGYYYTWNGFYWEGSESPTVVFSDTYVNNEANTYLYWYRDTMNDVTENNITYKARGLYKWNQINGWIEVNTLSGNITNRATSSLIQTATEIAANVTNARGWMAHMGVKITEGGAFADQVASVVTPLLDANGHKIKLDKQYILKEAPNGLVGVEGQYCAVGTELPYDVYLYTNGQWEKKNLLYYDGAYIMKINAASILLSANEDDARINIGGETIFASEDGAITGINGSCITTGTIKSNDGSIKIDLGNNTVDISGRVAATSGYIGDEANGFTIDRHKDESTYTVGAFGLSAGSYYFHTNTGYYQFELTDNLAEGDTITFDSEKDTVSGAYISNVICTDTCPADAIRLPLQTYYLSSNQTGLVGDGSRESGIYISPYGIGAGNGTFVVSSDGIIRTQGNVYFRDAHGYDFLTIESNPYDADKTVTEDGVTQLRPVSGTISMWGVKEYEENDITKYKYLEVFKLDPSNGSLTLSGDIIFSEGSNVTWGEIDSISASANSAVASAENAEGIANNTSTRFIRLVSGVYGTNEEIDPNFTFISGKNIYSPNLHGARISAIGNESSDLTDGLFSVNENASAFYIYNGDSTPDLKAFWGYDAAASETNILTPDGALTTLGDRVWFGTLNGAALKIQSSGDMSISAGTQNGIISGGKLVETWGNGTIYFQSNVHFSPNIKVTGLTAKAVFA